MRTNATRSSTTIAEASSVRWWLAYTRVKCFGADGEPHIDVWVWGFWFREKEKIDILNIYGIYMKRVSTIVCWTNQTNLIFFAALPACWWHNHFMAIFQCQCELKTHENAEKTVQTYKDQFFLLILVQIDCYKK